MGVDDTDCDHATVPSPPEFERTSAVADAVLYEGYLLYPYRRSSPKNRVRWQFGVLAPRPWVEARGPVADGVAGSAESWFQQTECLLEAPAGAAVHLRLRFLQLQAKSVQEPRPDGGFEAVDGLEFDGVTHLSFDEAVPREFDVVSGLADLLAGEREVRVEAPGGEDVQPLTRCAGQPAPRVVRRRCPVAAVVRLSARPASTRFPLVRLQARIENAVATLGPDRPRDEALRHALVATHSLVGLTAGRFLSLLEPPEWAAAAAADCANLRTFPVLGGEPDRRDVVLSSPIILYDHPQVAPESPGDLFDATEIDEILSLRTLTLTDEEKREARATDQRAAAIIDRVDGMPLELLGRLHGAIRSLRPGPSNEPAPRPASGSGVGAVAGPVARPVGGSILGADAVGDAGVGGEGRPAVPWWDPGADASVHPETDAVVVDGVRVGRGSRVRLRPRRRGTDAHDMFLAGRTAQVQAVFLDVDGTRHVAVTVDDDPGAELHEWYGRFRYYRPEELEPLGGRGEAAG